MKALKRIWQWVRCLRGHHRFELVLYLIPSEEDLWEALASGVMPYYERCTCCRLEVRRVEVQQRRGDVR